MGILDEAIKEHLELKRQHGAGQSELQKLEDEAFGPADRPGAQEAVSEQFSEAPTEFMSQPDLPDATQAPVESDAPASDPRMSDEGEPPEAPRSRRPAAHEIADLQEAPPTGEPAEEPSEAEEPSATEHAAISQQPEELQPQPHRTRPSQSLPRRSQSLPPSRSPRSTPEPPAPAGPSTEERQAIADQPTEHYDIEQELAASQPGPSEEELVDEEISEPRLAPADTLAGLEVIEESDSSPLAEGPAQSEPAETDEDEDDDFFDEKRLSDELDQAIEAPVEDEPDSKAGAGEGGWHTDEQDAIGSLPKPAEGHEDLLEETRTSSRRPRRTTSSGSSRSPRRTSTSTTRRYAPRLSSAGP